MNKNFDMLALLYEISYIYYNPLHYTQAFVFKTFHIFSPVLTSLFHKNTIETSLTSEKCRVAKFGR